MLHLEEYEQKRRFSMHAAHRYGRSQRYARVLPDTMMAAWQENSLRKKDLDFSMLKEIVITVKKPDEED